MSIHAKSVRVEPPTLERRALAIHVITVRLMSLCMLILGVLATLGSLLAVVTHQTIAARGLPACVLVGIVGVVGIGLHPRDLVRRDRAITDGDLIGLIGRCCGTLLAAGIVSWIMRLPGL